MKKKVPSRKNMQRSGEKKVYVAPIKIATVGARSLE